jgi:hypothetical protein
MIGELATASEGSVAGTQPAIERGWRRRGGRSAFRTEPSDPGRSSRSACRAREFAETMLALTASSRLEQRSARGHRRRGHVGVVGDLYESLQWLAVHQGRLSMYKAHRSGRHRNAARGVTAPERVAFGRAHRPTTSTTSCAATRASRTAGQCRLHAGSGGHHALWDEKRSRWWERGAGTGLVGASER